LSIETDQIRAFPEFAELDDSEIDELRAHLQPIALSPGSMLFRQGDQDTFLYLLAEGTVDVCVTLPDTGERANTRSTVATLEAKTVLGELGLLLSMPRTASIIARSDTVCWQITQQSFYAAIDRGDPWAARLALAIASTLARRFVSARAEVTRHIIQLESEAPESAPKVRELVELRSRLLAEWSF
jgi:CRP/FNR family transcriptional regulator, cyclic AMP receptor protein